MKIRKVTFLSLGVLYYLLSCVVHQVDGLSGGNRDSDSSKAYLGYGLADYKGSLKNLVKNHSATR